MAFFAKDILNRASIILQDAGAIRWPLPELLMWMNDGLREIAILKPSATATTMALDLVEGTRQTIPDSVQTIIEIIRNRADDGAPGRVVTPIARATLDRQIPGWHAPATLPFSPLVRHYMIESGDLRCFYVVPGNDGTGQVDAVVSRMPAAIPVPSDPLDPEAYTSVVPIHDAYQNVLLDYVLYRAYSKDAQLAGAAQRAVAHYQQFTTVLGVKGQNEAAASG